ncbi:3-oxoacyl-[acyl-carrier-protein] synthase 3 [Rickettsiales bacterium]|nr:3-oxoacyl-[acyl-carrier-protein] synthase 3 [Rickettsiales bacterium]
MYRAKIIGVGSCLPSKELTNFDLAKRLDTSDAWIRSHTGIRTRYIAGEGETLNSLATSAAAEAIKNAGVEADDIGLIIVATTTPERIFPSCAVAVQDNLQCRSAFAFDLQAVCAGFVYALASANSYIISGQVKAALVIGADIMSEIVDWDDRSTCVLFGDGAGAVVLTAAKDAGIISTHLYSDGSLQNILYTLSGDKLRMNGQAVFRHAVEKMSASMLAALESNSLSIDDVDWLIPHQANIRIINAIAQRLSISSEKVVITVDKHANTSAASIPLAMDHARGSFSSGDLIALTALGGGIAWGSILLRW